MDTDPFLIVPLRVQTRSFVADIVPIRFKDWAGFLAVLNKLAPFLSRGDYGGAVKAKEAALRDVIRLGAGVAPELLDDLHPDDIVALAGGVLTGNSDFYTRRVGPAIATATEALARTLRERRSDPADGPTSSPTLPPGDTLSTPAAS